MLKKTLIYLGLGPDEEYDSFDDYAPAAAAPAAPAAAAGSAERAQAAPPPTVRAVPDSATRGPGSTTVRPVAPGRQEPSGSVRVVPSDNPRPVEPLPVPEREPTGVSAIRIVDTPSATPHAVTPTAFNDAQGIGDRFKSGQPVIVNLQSVDRDLRRRLVDFASGLCYALGGKMDRVADQVYLLTPAGVVVSEADAHQALH